MVILPTNASDGQLGGSTNAVPGMLPLGLAEGIHNIGNSQNPDQALSSTLYQLAVNKTNQAINEETQAIVADSNFDSLEIVLADDSSKTSAEIMAVYGLMETPHSYLFNQTSLVNYDSNTTLNLGLGYRTINYNDTLILGINGFYDYELSSKHQRYGMGVEALTSGFQLRSNVYRAESGTITYNSKTQAALHGADTQISYQLPFFYASDVYYKNSRWWDGDTHETKTTETGLSISFTPNLTLNVASQKTDSNASKTVAQLRLSMPIGEQKPYSGEFYNGFNTELQSVRHLLKKPVERENRIKKKSLTSPSNFTITASGF